MCKFSHFDFLAPIYERAIRPNIHGQFFQLAQLPTPGIILDAGGGTGRVAQTIIGQTHKVIVADLSMGMLQQAALKDGLITVCTLTENLPFPDNSFERIIMIDALHHVIDAKETTFELWRVLKPGGRILIEEPDIRTLPVKILALLEKFALMRSHFISPPIIKSLFQYPSARINIVKNIYMAWITIDKEI